MVPLTQLSPPYQKIAALITGKGMDIKGKSATRGKWSGFVPFLQIHRNEDKLKVGSLHADGRVRVFYPNEHSRNRAFMTMSMVREKMIRTTHCSLNVINKIERKQAFALDVEMHKSTKNLTHCTQPAMRNAIGNACRRLSTVVDYSKFEQALEEVHHNSMIDDAVYKIDDYASSARGRGYYGLDVPEKLFWQVYISKTDISREAGSDYDTGRASMPEFQTMNLESLRKAPKAGPRPVLWHAGCGQVGEEPPQDVNPLCPFGLLMAYEERDKDTGKVTPVVSDFDCFLVGTRGVEYRDPLGDQELSILKWCVDEIEGVLENNKDKAGARSWTRQWLDVKKKYAFDPRFQAPMPKMGYADPRSSALMKGAVYSLRENGAVRHGPECFNYSFPQPLDDKFLVISDTLPGLVPWKYVDIKELKEILSEKIDDGFAFPLNPKWILCDEGWKDLYDKLLASEAPRVQDAMDIWYPADVRERIAAISLKHPIEFESNQGSKDRTAEGLAAMKQKRRLPVSRSQTDDEFMTDLAELELERYKHAERGRAKLRRALLKTKKEKKTKEISFFSSVLLMLRMGGKNDVNTHTKHTENGAEKDSGREKSGSTKLRNKWRRKSSVDTEKSASSIASFPSERSVVSHADQTQTGSKKLRSRSEHSWALSTTIASFPSERSERSAHSQADGKGNHDERPSRRRSSWFKEKKAGRGLVSNYIRKRLSIEKRQSERRGSY